MSQSYYSAALTFQKVHPKEFLNKFLMQGLRPDSRKFDECRQIDIVMNSIKTSEGSCMVKVGNTTVVCGVKAEVAPPLFESPDCGFIVPNLELGPLCSPHIKPGPPTDQAQLISDYLERIIKSCNMVDLTDLCIEAGKAVWCLYVDIICIADGGSVLDASVIALSSALKSVKLPQSKFYEEEGMVKINPTQTTELNLKTLVYPLTFGIWNEEIILSDLTHQEESIIPETFTLLIDNSGNIRNLQYSGLISLNTEKLENCLNLALARRDTILGLIDDGSKGFK